MPPHGAALGTVASSFRLPQETIERYRTLVINIKLEKSESRCISLVEELVDSLRDGNDTKKEINQFLQCLEILPNEEQRYRRLVYIMRMNQKIQQLMEIQNCSLSHEEMKPFCEAVCQKGLPGVPNPEVMAKYSHASSVSVCTRRKTSTANGSLSNRSTITRQTMYHAMKTNVEFE